MRRPRSTALTVCVLLAGLRPAQAQDAPPHVLSQTVAPVYPALAIADGIAGTVSVRVTVSAGGAVENIEVIAVPREGLGFESAVSQAIRQWQFGPALKAGTPVEGVLSLSIPFRLRLMGDYVIATDPATAWTHVKSLMAQMKYKTVRLDEEHQYLVTEETNYARTLPDLKQLGIVKDGRPTRVKWYVSVPRDFAAARLSIASEVQVVNGREVYTVYRTPPLAEWFRDQLSRHMTLSIEPLSSDVQERTNRSSPISEPDHRSCSPPASPIMVRDTPVPNLRMPQVLQEYKPFFPQGEMRQQHEGSVLLQGVVMEHGSVTSIKILRSPDDSPGFVTNAIAAAAMWRFLPARVDGCPVPMTITIELSFKLR